MNDTMPGIRFSIGKTHIAFPLCVEAYTVREELIDEDEEFILGTRALTNKVIYYNYCNITVLCFNVEICVKRKEIDLPPVYNGYEWEG